MKTISMKISDNSVNKLLPIVGAKFESNNCYQSRNCSIDFFKRKLMTSPGPYISDYVTHQNDFKYNTLGIHVGQIDRLTFMGGDGRTIIGHLIDCRKGSPTYGIRLRIEYNASMGRKLIIPMGVAHSFENLQNVVTRDEPIWYSSFYNKDWDISNDLISIPLDVSYEDLPEIQVNQFRLPVKAHIFFSQLQQENLKNAKAYADRFKNEYGQYQLQTEEWSELPMDFTSSYDSLLKIDGVKWLKNSYALTGPRSFTIVPSSKSCVSDVVELDFSGDTHAFRCHKRQNSLLTFLDREGTKMFLELVDLRQASRHVESMEIVCDPRVRLVIPAGVAYRMRADGRYLLRFESEILLDENEPRIDLPQIGGDCLLASEEDLLKMPIFVPPKIFCPEEAIWLLVDSEAQNNV